MTCPSSDEPAILSIIILIFSENFVSYNLRISIYITEPFSCYDITTLYKQHGGPYREKGLAFLTFYKFAINHRYSHLMHFFLLRCMQINVIAQLISNDPSGLGFGIKYTLSFSLTPFFFLRCTRFLKTLNSFNVKYKVQ